MTLYEKFKELDIDLSQLGLERGDTRSGYFCTPKGAEVIGWAGVDGIHCCFVKGFGETVFTVSPMNTRGNYVKPVAKTFEDFLRLLLACGGVDAIEQAWMWSPGEFDAFMETYPPSEKKRAVLDELAERLALTRMDNPYGYIKGVQAGFDYGRLVFPEEYYELGADEPETEEPPERPEWRVCFENGFGSHVGRGRPGQEIPVNRAFSWGGRNWLVPAVYACGKGLVADFCMEVDVDAYRAFLEKWRPFWEGEKAMTPEEQERQTAENPMAADFRPTATVNGKRLRLSSGNGFGWVPMALRQEYEQGEINRQDWEAVWLMEHYGLDEEKCWTFWRQSFPWATKTKPKLKTLRLALEQERQAVPGMRFTVSGAGDAVSFTHPVTGEKHTLKVIEYEEQEMDAGNFGDAEEWEYPTHYTAMAYEVEPELPRGELTVRDCGQGDRPRMKRPDPAGPTAASSVGILMATGKAGQPRAAASALRFEAPERIEWRTVFYRKTVEDMELELPL
ncbi:MAG: hypothetical protein NC319_01995 [Butyricicoccus sp.]|nr:hypothetical protein [Butyricicoccus sp.]